MGAFDKIKNLFTINYDEFDDDYYGDDFYDVEEPKKTSKSLSLLFSIVCFASTKEKPSFFIEILYFVPNFKAGITHLPWASVVKVFFVSKIVNK